MAIHSWMDGSLMPAKKIGKYEIVQELGRGGMGVVYKAYDTVMDREVALKVILDIAMHVPEIKARFYREAQTAGKLTHENITVVYDVGEDDGRPYIVMEYLPGNDLRSLLDRKQPLPLLQKLEIAVQVARGLAYSHSREIIHRDIKPANIRVVDERRVKIMDFGIAKPEASNATSAGTVVGTPYYMAPEQIQGAHVDKRSDIFSYGVLLYELLSGYKPFTGNEPTAVMYKIVHAEPEHREELDRNCPPALREIVTKLLKKNPAERYQQLDEVAGHLEGISAGIRTGGSSSNAYRRKFEKLLADATAFLAKGRLRDALQAADRAGAIDPTSSQLLRLRDQIRAAQAEEQDHVRVAQLLTRARKAYGARRLVDAINLCNDILAVAPTMTEASGLLEKARHDHAADIYTQAYAAYRKCDFSEAERQARDVLALHPNYARARALLKTLQHDREVPDPEPPAEQQTQGMGLPALPPAQPGGKEARHRPLVPRHHLTPAAIVGGVLVFGSIAAYLILMTLAGGANGTVALNITPWAEVVQIEQPGGTPVQLKEKFITPCRIELRAGTYNIHVANPSLQTTMVLTVKVKGGTVQEVRKKMPGFDYDNVLSTF
jgi:predicted Ser/Thr protein kinase